MLALFKAREWIAKLSFRFLAYLHKPTSPYNLAVCRILFGLMMLLDIPDERGLASAEERWGDPHQCRFPLLDFLRPLTLEWMCLLYLTMILGSLGMLFGTLFRASCLLFAIPYWYLFFLDKSRWNNHSYLYGILSVVFFFTGANCCWSVDGVLFSKLRFTHVPRWNYVLLRGQIFLVYFIAGLKKMDADWVQGYSMDYLASHWVFSPFRYFLSAGQIDLLVIHWGGFLLDLTSGFFLLRRSTRPYALLFCSLFHLMNAQIFAIGMFAYVMLATGPLFCSFDWPMKLIHSCSLLPARLGRWVLYDTSPARNADCLYQEKNQNCVPVAPRSPDEMVYSSEPPIGQQVTTAHKVTGLVICLYFGLQLGLPFSHRWTPGYNTWTEGPYGYSWDMMVHSWRHVHTRLTLLDAQTGDIFYLDPNAWTSNWRWTHQADMVKQLGACVAERMRREHNITELKFYVDVWLSLNGRITQRVFDPTVDVLTAPWSPFRPVEWVLPLLSDLTTWRDLIRLTTEEAAEGNYSDVLFFADFPGYSFVNFVDPDLSEVHLKVLQGEIEMQVAYQPQSKKLKRGDKARIVPGVFHRVSAMGHKAACYYYGYVNATLRQLDAALDNHKKGIPGSLSTEIPPMQMSNFLNWKSEEEAKMSASFVEMYTRFARSRLQTWIKSASLLRRSLRWLLWGETMRNNNNIFATE